MRKEQFFANYNGRNYDYSNNDKEIELIAEACCIYEQELEEKNTRK
ncbi:MAG: hypothetical protein ACOX28_03340 [Bacilli bacterium]|jgi:hypothetical protein